MYFSPFDLRIVIYFVLFLSALTVSIYAPGRLLLSTIKLSNPIEKIVLINIVGICLWAIQGYIFGYLQLRFLTYLYVVFAMIYLFINRQAIYLELNEFLGKLRSFKYILVIIIVGTFMQMLSVVGSGFLFSDGVRFFGNTEADGVMHLAYIQSISSHFPPIEPGFSGETLRNYHFWSDLVMADFHRIWKLPVSLTFFQFMPLYIALLTGLAAMVLVKALRGGMAMIFWFVFLLYFSSDAAFLVILLIHGDLGFHTPAIDNGLMQFLNMPHVFGKLIFLGLLIAFVKWVKGNGMWGFITVLLASSLIGMKVYFGIYAAIGLASYSVGFFIKEYILTRSIQKSIRPFLFLILFVILSLIIYLPTNVGAGGLVYVYLEWPRSLLGIGSIDWRDWWLRRQIYEAYGNFRNLMILDAIAVGIAFISIYGTRLLGFIPSRSLFKFVGWQMVVFVLPGLIIFQLLGLFTIQSSGGVNVFNFFAVSSVLLSLFTSFYLSKARSKIAIVCVAVFLLITLPRTIFDFTNFFNSYYGKASTTVSSGEIAALNFIHDHMEKDAIIQAHPNNSYNATSPYVAYYSGRETFLGGENLLKTHNVDTTIRKAKLEEIFRSADIIDFVSKLQQLEIQYVLLRNVSEERLKFEMREDLLKKVFENSEVVVLQVYSK